MTRGQKRLTDQRARTLIAIRRFNTTQTADARAALRIEMRAYRELLAACTVTVTGRAHEQGARAVTVECDGPADARRAQLLMLDCGYRRVAVTVTAPEGV